MLIIFAINQTRLDGFRNTNENNKILCNLANEGERGRETQKNTDLQHTIETKIQKARCGR